MIDYSTALSSVLKSTPLPPAKNDQLSSCHHTKHFSTYFVAFLSPRAASCLAATCIKWYQVLETDPRSLKPKEVWKTLHQWQKVLNRPPETLFSPSSLYGSRPHILWTTPTSTFLEEYASSLIEISHKDNSVIRRATLSEEASYLTSGGGIAFFRTPVMGGAIEKSANLILVDQQTGAQLCCVDVHKRINEKFPIAAPHFEHRSINLCLPLVQDNSATGFITVNFDKIAYWNIQRNAQNRSISVVLTEVVTIENTRDLSTPDCTDRMICLFLSEHNKEPTKLLRYDFTSRKFLPPFTPEPTQPFVNRTSLVRVDNHRYMHTNSNLLFLADWHELAAYDINGEALQLKWKYKAPASYLIDKSSVHANNKWIVVPLHISDTPYGERRERGYHILDVTTGEVIQRYKVKGPMAFSGMFTLRDNVVIWQEGDHLKSQHIPTEKLLLDEPINGKVKDLYVSQNAILVLNKTSTFLDTVYFDLLRFNEENPIVRPLHTRIWRCLTSGFWTAAWKVLEKITACFCSFLTCFQCCGAR